MVIYKVLDRVIYNPTNSTDKSNFQYGTVIDIDNIYLFIRFYNNEHIFKKLYHASINSIQFFVS